MRQTNTSYDINCNNFPTDRLWKQMKCAHLLPSSGIFVNMRMPNWTIDYASVFVRARLSISVKSFRLYRYTCRKHVNNQGFTNLISVGPSLIRAISWYRTKFRVIVSYLCHDDLYKSLIPRGVFIFTGLKQEVCLFLEKKTRTNTR